MKRLRSGYTTGACAAAAAKGATLLLLGQKSVVEVDIPLPKGMRVHFPIAQCGWLDSLKTQASCSVIKDAGDDPDVTNGAEIVATVHLQSAALCQDVAVEIIGGEGVGIVTKPGLALPVGVSAINPGPLQMITQAVGEVLSGRRQECCGKRLVVSISIPGGEELARKTLNKRLGILGGLSILGTTGIVVPVSAEAWTATISASMDVARSCGVQEIVLSTGRTSERAVEEYYGFPEEAYIMMGDYLEFSLKQATLRRFDKIHLAAMWAKMLKGALRVPQTHVRHGALDVAEAIAFLQKLDLQPDTLDYLYGSNTAREIYERLLGHGAQQVVHAVCQLAKDYYQSVAGLPVVVYLVNASGKIVESV